MSNKSFVDKIKSAKTEDEKRHAFMDWLEELNEQRNLENRDVNMEQPDYYKMDGLSPIDAFKQGLISKEEYIGFLKGNIIKYTIRAGKKEDAIKDLEKAKHYIEFYIELYNEGINNDKPIKIQ